MSVSMSHAKTCDQHRLGKGGLSTPTFTSRTLRHCPLESVITLLVKSDCFARDICKKRLIFCKAFEQLV
jgi:hypothetical protein